MPQDTPNTYAANTVEKLQSKRYKLTALDNFIS